ncbi:MAG: hypothetical protein K940chlam7_01422 [Chlamydiae bacterium]|nr:hypothetical protein [Chlamydiota bacterium]
MRDTHPDITQKIYELIKRKTHLERLMMGCSMYETSKYLIVRAIKEKTPLISKSALRQEIFLHFYGNDFDYEQRKKIIQYLSKDRVRESCYHDSLP